MQFHRDSTNATVVGPTLCITLRIRMWMQALDIQTWDVKSCEEILYTIMTAMYLWTVSIPTKVATFHVEKYGTDPRSHYKDAIFDLINMGYSVF